MSRPLVLLPAWATIRKMPLTNLVHFASSREQYHYARSRECKLAAQTLAVPTAIGAAGGFTVMMFSGCPFDAGVLGFGLMAGWGLVIGRSVCTTWKRSQSHDGLGREWANIHNMLAKSSSTNTNTHAQIGDLYRRDAAFSSEK